MKRIPATLLLFLLLTDCGQSQSPVTATNPTVRCIVGNTCGSGTICGVTADGAYILTNAHVAGTALGTQVTIDCITSTEPTRTKGVTQYTGYSSKRMVDYALLFAPQLKLDKPRQLLRTEPKQTPFTTRGSPRCVWPPVLVQLTDPQRYGDGLLTALPNAIGGQSGSSIYDQNGDAVALLTWSMNGRTAGQTTEKLYLIATTMDAHNAADRPQELQELVFGTDRQPCQDAIQAIAANSIADLPIWTGGTLPPTNPDCPPQSAFDWLRFLTLLIDLLNQLRQSAELPT